MNLEFDCNELFAQFNASCQTFVEIDEKASDRFPQTNEAFSGLVNDEQHSNLFTLSIQDPKQINHVWFDKQQDPLIQKLLINSRKDTLADDQMCNNESSEPKRRKKTFKDPLRNQTKNIPKNYGKAIVAFALTHQEATKHVLKKFKAGSYKDFVYFLEESKKEITTIAQLRSLWVDNPYEQVLRTLSCHFLRKHSLNYIFNSRINNHGTHIKYRQRFLEVIKAPQEFKHIKQY